MNLRRLYNKYNECVVRIAIETPEGVQSNAAGFHVGDGVIATARHVVKGNRILEVRSGGHGIGVVTVNDVILATDPKVDLAILKTNFQLDHYLTKVTFVSGGDEDVQRNADKTDYVPIGEHLNEWIDDGFMLSKVIVMGFPRIPLSKEPVLAAYAGEVSAITEIVGERHPYFIISPIARGGFSGGPVISEFDFLLGVITQSFVEDDKGPETGYFSLLSVEPLLELLATNGIRPPGIDDEFWELFTN
jgi:S1-C subfamily serine protease